MPDEPITPVEQTPSTTENSPKNIDLAPKSGDMWEARFKGQVAVIEKLTIGQRALTDQLAAKTSECEQLQEQLILKDTEKTLAVGEREKQLSEMLTAKSAADKELTDLRALQLKVKVIKELKRPELLKIADSLPNIPDEEALKAAFNNFAGFADEAVRAREAQLLSGVTPALTGLGGAEKTVPQTAEAWTKHIESLALGSPERRKAQDDQWDWLVAHNQPK